jgi:hypothetical protein
MISVLALLLATVFNVAPPNTTYSCDGAATVYAVPYPYGDPGDLQVTATNAAGVVSTLSRGFDFTLSPSASTTVGVVTLLAGSRCPNGSLLRIVRSTPLTQPTNFRTQGQYLPAIHESAFDRMTRQLQEINGKIVNPVLPSALTNATPVTATGTSTPRQLADWFTSPHNVTANGAVANGSTNDASAIQTTLNASSGITFLPSSPSCYNIGTTTLTIPSGRTLQGAGMGAPNSGPTCITYTGTGCAILMDSTQFSAIRDIDLQVNSTSPTAIGICMKGTSVVAEFNEISGVSVRQTNATRRVAGQVGLQLKDNGQGVYWNTFKRLRFAYWDNAIQLVGGSSGANANNFEDLMSYGHVTAFHTFTTQVTNNRVFGMHCSRSDSTWLGTSNCVVIGDDNSSSQFNSFFFVTSDQATPATCFTFGTGAGGNVVFADCQSGGAAFASDSNATAFPNFIYDTINASAPGFLHLGHLATKTEIAIGPTPSTTGDLRFSNNQSIRWRNAANGADMTGVVVDANDRLKLGSSTAFARLDNNVVEHGTGTVANTGNERYTSNWAQFARNAANSGNIRIWDFGTTVADVTTIGDANAASVNLGQLTPFTNATLGTPGNGVVRFCSDCTIANPCAGGGNGALAKRLNGIWVCN